MSAHDPQVLSSHDPQVVTHSRAWELVIEHIGRRRPAMGAVEDIVDRVIADMQVRAAGVSINAEDPMMAAYRTALDFAAHLTLTLDTRGASLDDPVDISGPHGWALVRVQSMLWDHMRTIVQLRALIEERTAERSS